LTAIRLYARGTNPEFLERSEEEIARVLLQEAARAMTIRSAPLATAVTRHEQAIPQYAVGHSDTINQVERLLCRLPGVSLIGNAYSGIGIANCVERAENAAAMITERASLLQPRHLVF
jgi:oxygen-dependent protoporphyrinogen oxidase